MLSGNFIFEPQLRTSRNFPGRFDEFTEERSFHEENARRIAYYLRGMRNAFLFPLNSQFPSFSGVDWTKRAIKTLKARSRDGRMTRRVSIIEHSSHARGLHLSSARGKGLGRSAARTLDTRRAPFAPFPDVPCVSAESCK